MSGKPSPDKVFNFRIELDRYAKAASNVRKLSEEIRERSASLKSETERMNGAQHEMFKLIEDMDVACNDNYGWEGRASWFFAELYTQIVESQQ